MRHRENVWPLASFSPCYLWSIGNQRLKVTEGDRGTPCGLRATTIRGMLQEMLDRTAGTNCANGFYLW